MDEQEIPPGVTDMTKSKSTEAKYYTLKIRSMKIEIYGMTGSQPCSIEYTSVRQGNVSFA